MSRRMNRAALVGAALLFLSAAGCSSGPTHDQFVDQMLKVTITPGITADQSARLRSAWGCAYDHLDDDSTKARIMELKPGDKLASEDSATLSTILANQCKAEMDAGTSPDDTATTTTAVPAS